MMHTRKKHGWWTSRPALATTLALALAVSAGAAITVPANAVTTPKPSPPRPEAVSPARSMQDGAGFGSYLAGRHASQHHDQGAAAQFLSEALAADPENTRLLHSTVVSLAAGGQMVEAMALAGKLVTLDPDSEFARLIVFVDAVASSNLEQAKRQLAGLSRDGVYGLLAPMLDAWVEFGLGDMDAALEAMQPLANRKAYEPYFAFHAALIGDLAGKPIVAEEYYLKAVQSVPGGTLRVVASYGAFLERHGRPDDARALYLAYLSNNPSALWLEPAMARLDEGGKAPIEIDGLQAGVAEVLFGLGKLLPQDTGGEVSLIYSRMALHLRPDFPEAQVLVAEVYETLDRLDDAVAAYNRIPNDSRFSWTARLRAATNLASLDRTEDAVSLLRVMVDEKVGRTDAATTLGDVLRYAERYAEAVVAYDAAVARTGVLEARHWFLLYSRGVSLERTKQWARAEADFLRALELSPDQPPVLNYLGYSWLEQGMHLERAQAMIEKAVSLRPNDGYIVDSLGWAFYRLGDYDRAVRQLERAVELMPNDPVINDHLGDALWRVGRRLEARFQWTRSIELGAEEEVAAEIRRKLSRGLQAEADADDDAS